MIRNLLSGKDAPFGKSDQIGDKRKRKSLNALLNEIELSQPTRPSLDTIDEVLKLRAVNEVQGRKLGSIQALFEKVRVPTHSRNDGGSVLKYGKIGRKVKAYAIS